VFSGPRKLIRRLRFWLRHAQFERDLREEIEEHRRLRGAASVVSPTIHVEDARAVWIPPRLDSFFGDLRYGARQLRHNRLFTVVSVAGLALAIGLNTAVFSVVDAVFWRPLPVADGDRVIRLLRLERDDRSRSSFSESELRHYQESGALEAVTGFAVDPRLTADWQEVSAPRAIAGFVAPNFFTMLGGEAIAGRLLLPDDGATVVVITESAWRRRLLANPEVIGAKLRLNGFPFTIVGVVADKSVAITESPIDVVLPLHAAPLLRLADTLARMRLLGKLHREMTLEQAQTPLSVAAQRWFTTHPEDSGVYRPLAIPARLAGSRPTGSADRALVLLPIAVLLVLLIACANLTNLLLARAEARRREMAVRLSLGAARIRLIRQLLTECFLLTTLAGLLGMVCANAALRLTLAILPRYIPIELTVPWFDVSINETVFLYTLGLCALTTFLFGLAPALEATRTDLAYAARGDARGGQRPLGFGARDVLIAAQMAACMILLVISASLNSSMSVLDDFLSALDSRPVIQAYLPIQGYGYSAGGAQQFLQRVLQRRGAGGLSEPS